MNRSNSISPMALRTSLPLIVLRLLWSAKLLALGKKKNKVKLFFYIMNYTVCRSLFKFTNLYVHVVNIYL